MYGPTSPGAKDQRLLIEAREQGWWYAAPLPDARAVVAFMTDADLLPDTSNGRTAYFHAQLHPTKLIRAFATQLPATSRVVGFRANSSIRHVIRGNGWVSTGDATATYDPLSGRGVPAALAKGAAIARLVSNCSDCSCALKAYADAERATFADFRFDQQNTYRRAAGQFTWARRMTI
jgi:flavin-dependent dehydrogenase